MKVAIVLVLLVASACASPVKRSLGQQISDTFYYIINSITNYFNSLGKDIQSIKQVDFDRLVNALIPKNSTGMTETACISACTATSASVLGSAAPLAAPVCGSACEAALDKLKVVAGK